ncbi:TonB-dependent receptor [Sphingosinicella humi]|uniref:TonB-dependent receptor n=1 Tax=Allosphingosinicella humi TaxID=2068657 RepID=A0A2U2J145_9SPHN|nr:TonB-dependent receptor [Sphingosinicella humi]
MTCNRMGVSLSRFLLSAALIAILPAAAHAQDTAQRGDDGSIIVTAMRAEKPLNSIPALVTVIDEEEIDQQRLIATDTSSLLANLVPSFSPSRQKLSGFGESFRGRDPLYLIDGVPQSNPLRNGSRDGYTIDLIAVERVEVINGANAIQGLGATGGIVNFVTRKPDRSGEWTVGIETAVTAADDFSDDGFEHRAGVYASKRFGDFDFLGSASYHKRGLFFDGHGRAIAVDATQGDLADSMQTNFFGKFGWEPTDDQRLQFTINKFDLEGDGDWSTDPESGDRAAGIPVTSQRGAPEGEPPLNDVLTMSLDYTHRAFLGGTFTGQLYRQDFKSTFGGDRFAIFQDPAIAPVGTLFDQSQNRSEKLGARLTQRYTDIAGSGADVIGGIDYLEDTTSQALIHTGRFWVPETTYENIAPFIQLDLPLTDRLTLAGGLRWENAILKVDDYNSIAGNRPDLVETPVIGGSPSFDELLFNGSAIYEFLDGVSAYASYSQGYTVPDVGRVLRAIKVPNTSVDDLLTLSPVIADNYEAGLTVSQGFLTAQLAYFISKSNQGSRLVADAEGIFSVVRQKTRVEGLEATLEAALGSGFRVGGNLSVLKGEVDSDNDGRLDADLDAINIGPNRLNLYAGWSNDALSFRLQSATLFDRNFENAAGLNTANFEGYTLFDLHAGYRTDFGTLSFAVQNLADKQYITYFGQAGSTLDEDFFAGRGRTFTLGYSTEF